MGSGTLRRAGESMATSLRSRNIRTFYPTKIDMSQISMTSDYLVLKVNKHLFIPARQVDSQLKTPH